MPQPDPRRSAGPLFCVAEHEPAAPDGQTWRDEAIAIVRRLVSERGYVTASLLRYSIDDPPHPSHWGSLWARLRSMGLKRTRDEVPSEIATRNAARDSVWVPGEAWV